MDREALKVRRRDFLRGCAVTAAASTIPLHGFFAPGEALASEAPTTPGIQVRSLVRPMIGTGWRGHIFPGAVAPFGLVQLSPDTSGPPKPMWNETWNLYHGDHTSGYDYPDNVILGFSHTHLQGTGAYDLGDVLMMPLVEGRNWSWNPGAPGDEAQAQIEALGPNSGWVFSAEETGYRSFFSHDEERARAGYYGVHLKTPDVYAELTATTRCGMHRYRYPALKAGTKRGLMLDLIHGVGGEVIVAGLRIESPTRVSGFRTITDGWGDGARQVYFVAEFSRPFASAEVKVDGAVRAAKVGDHLTGKDIQAIFTQSPDAQPLVIRVGISGTSVAGAGRNLAKEIPGWDFDGVVRQNERAWAKALSVLTAELPSEALQQTFDTGAYHGLSAPAIFNDVDGTYRGQDRRNHPNPGFTKYTTISIWDIFRAEFPFIMLTEPHRINDVVRTLLTDYQQLGRDALPMAPFWGNEAWSMLGFHAVAMIASAYVRGFRDYDVEAVYAAIRETAMVGTTAKDSRTLQEEFRSRGYIATGPDRRGVTHTTNYAYDYWCAGAMADLLGKRDDAAMFYKLGQNYKNVFDPVTGFMRGKTADGQWRKPFRPDTEYWEDYTESNAWQATFNVMQDVQGLIGLYGGDAQFIAKLDALFTAPSNAPNSSPDILGMVGQDAQGNEPSNHIPYLYSFAGAPWKTQHWVRKVAALYRNTPQGLPGNDDCGQLSSWFVFTALGFYPVNPVNGVYVFGSPLVNRASLRNPATGTTFTIVAENNSAENVYIQSATLNGRRLARSWFTHADIVKGGELRFVMGREPNKQWGSAPADRPPSGLLMGRA